MKRSGLWLSMLAAIAAFVALASTPATAAISDEEELARFGGAGPGAGQLQNPQGIAVDPTTGHIYVAEAFLNNRVSEFTPWGDFVKAFGWDVAPGTVNEQQEVRVRAADGQFRLTFGASTTTDLAFHAPGSESEGPGSVEAALNALPSIEGVGGEVGVQAVPGTPDGQTPFIYVVAFEGSLAATNVAQLVIGNGSTSPSGGVPTTSLEVRTRAEGHAATTGLESCTAESGCKAGLEGGGAGQLAFPRGMAVDADGNVYVREVSNRRVQKFDSAGRFLLMFGGEVNKTTSGSVCTAVSGDMCGIGIAGSGNGQFGAGFAGDVALGSGGRLFVGDIERIQRFNPEGVWEASVPVAGKTVHNLAPADGDFYATVGTPAGTEENVRILDGASGVEKGKLEGAQLENSKGEAFPGTKATGAPLAVGPTGEIFTGRPSPSLGEGEEPARPALQFDAAGEQVSEFGRTLNALSGFAASPIGTLYVAYGVSNGLIAAFGSAPAPFEAPPKAPPEIATQFAASVGRTEATVAAEINPRFWTDTTYYVEYGIGKCSEGGCTEATPAAPAILTSKVTGASVKTAGVFLGGLKQGTTYHYRFVAESTGGGPVRGIGGEVGVDGEESSFTTYPAPAPSKTDCPNQRFRTGTSAPLPDCRAYEMVSPLDKNNGDIRALLDFPAFTTALSQSAEDGNRFTYSSYRGFADPEAAPYTNQYLATREDGVGWSSQSLNVAETSHFRGNATFENSFKAFSSDLCDGWLTAAAEPVLAPGGSPGLIELYWRDNCGSEGYDALIEVASRNPSSELILLARSSAAKAALFVTNDKLTPEAAGGKAWQAYHGDEGGLALLCILPNGSPSGGNCSAGTGPAKDLAGISSAERLSSVSHALSEDGSRAYWTDSGADASGPGKLYLRLNPGEEQSEVLGEECTEPEKACTVEVSETATTKAARFLRASADGSKAIFEVAEGAQQGSLFLFDLEAADSTLIAAKGLGVAGASEDLSRIYFVSRDMLPEASGATAGKANLYLDQEGTKTFITTMSNTDGNTSPTAIHHAARATPDGQVLAFVSRGSLTGYDNTDLLTGKADLEVYLYEAGTAEPVCVSCSPSGARPLGRVVSEPPQVTGPIAAWLAMPDNALYAPRVLSNDGQQLFFNSFDALLPRDTNGKADVYQWQKAEDQKACDQAGAELYVPSSGGCLSLISTGQSPQDSELLDISANGQDAFFTTNASLLPQDPGLVDVYDARANGGLPIPPEPPGPCQGEACQSATAPPNDPTPASASFRGAGNPSAKPRPRCAKGKARRKGRCVAKRRGQGKGAKRKRTNREAEATR